MAFAGDAPTARQDDEGKVMKQEASHHGNAGVEVHHRKPWRIAEKFEGYVGVVMVIAGLVLLAVLAYGVLNTGSATPTWMR